jgi:hypothetical protein
MTHGTLLTNGTVREQWRSRSGGNSKLAIPGRWRCRKLGKAILIPSGKHTKTEGESPFLMGKSTINHQFSIAMLVYQRVLTRQLQETVFRPISPTRKNCGALQRHMSCNSWKPLVFSPCQSHLNMENQSTHMKSVQNPCWLMISSGIILPNILLI